MPTIWEDCLQVSHFRCIKIQFDSEAQRTQTKKMNIHAIQFLCLCPLALAVMLNFNISKAIYCGQFMEYLSLPTPPLLTSLSPKIFFIFQADTSLFLFILFLKI